MTVYFYIQKLFYHLTLKNNILFNIRKFIFTRKMKYFEMRIKIKRKIKYFSVLTGGLIK